MIRATAGGACGADVPMTSGDAVKVRVGALDLDGWAYRYVDDGAGPPVVMVHGNPSWSLMYRDLIAALRDRYRTIAPDHIGMGRSDTPPASRYPYSLRRRVEDFGRFLTHLDLDEPITLVVHDWGGMIALAWAVEHPDQVRRLVLFNTAAFPLPAGKRLPAGLRVARTPLVGSLLVRGLNAFAVGAATAGVVRGPLPPAVRRAYLAPYGSWAQRIAVHAFVRDIPLHPGHPAWAIVSRTAARLERLRDMPALICWANRDPVFDLDYLAEWQRRLPEAEVVRVDAGHYLLEDAGAEIVPAVRDFLDCT